VLDPQKTLNPKPGMLSGKQNVDEVLSSFTSVIETILFRLNIPSLPNWEEITRFTD
jgi:hypothetical protein